MKIGLYAQPSRSVLGGTDVCVAVLASGLAASHQVEILHHGSAVTIDGLAEFSGTDLAGVRLRRIAPLSPETSESYNPLRRYQQARNAGRHWSAGYDLFVAFVHDPPPFCHARRGILVVLFPMFTPYHRTPACSGSSRMWDRARRAYASLEWRRRIGSYTTVVAISAYTRNWAQRLWGTDAAILYPPAGGGDVMPADKSSLVLSVGRFTAGGHVKCQLELVGAFAGLDLPGWRYVSAGALGSSPGDQAYAARVREAAANKPITVASNLDRAAVRDLYGHAKIFWHAAGLSNTDDVPYLNEHFGISTVEAMAAGCVPVVINKGGQPEIVEHGVSGFLWNTFDELSRYTCLLASDDALWCRMSRAAIERARRFDRAHYLDGFFRLMGLP
jgi:glycosyltransferase involved in cell wall biosynthesis